MKRALPGILAGVSLLALGLVLATGIGAGPPSDAVPAGAVAAPAALGQELSPLMQEIAAVLRDQESRLAELRQRLRTAGDPRTALELQRAVERLKLDTEVQILRLQAREARAAGRQETALRLEAAVEDLLHPERRLAALRSTRATAPPR